MCRNTRLPRRAGFTLIELLVVVAILTLLAAITAAGVGRVRSAQQARVTDDTLNKIQLALDSQWKAVAEDAGDSKKVPPLLVDFCDRDLDRAKALNLYLNLKREFPETFAEARTAITLVNPSTAQTVVNLNPRQTFAATKPATITPPNDPDLEGAVLLYLILSEKSSKGVQFAADDVTAGAQTDVTVGGVAFRTFKDAWGKPISFRRFFQHAELNAPPFALSDNAIAIKDPLDVKAKLSVASWPTSGTANRSAAAAAVGLVPLGGTTPDFNSMNNKVITAFSVGQNGVSEGPLGDDHYGYRLRRQGTQN